MPALSPEFIHSSGAMAGYEAKPPSMKQGARAEARAFKPMMDFIEAVFTKDLKLRGNKGVPNLLGHRYSQEHLPIDLHNSCRNDGYWFLNPTEDSSNECLPWSRVVAVQENKKRQEDWFTTDVMGVTSHPAKRPLSSFCMGYHLRR
jgi:hypothetical protein